MPRNCRTGRLLNSGENSPHTFLYVKMPEMKSHIRAGVAITVTDKEKNERNLEEPELVCRQHDLKVLYHW